MAQKPLATSDAAANLYQVPLHLCKTNQLSAADYQILSALAVFANRELKAFPGWRTLAAVLNLEPYADRFKYLIKRAQHLQPYLSIEADQRRRIYQFQPDPDGRFSLISRETCQLDMDQRAWRVFLAASYIAISRAIAIHEAPVLVPADHDRILELTGFSGKYRRAYYLRPGLATLERLKIIDKEQFRLPGYDWPARLNQITPRLNQIAPRLNEITPRLNQIAPRLNEIATITNLNPSLTNSNQRAGARKNPIEKEEKDAWRRNAGRLWKELGRNRPQAMPEADPSDQEARRQALAQQLAELQATQH